MIHSKDLISDLHSTEIMIREFNNLCFLSFRGYLPEVFRIQRDLDLFLDPALLNYGVQFSDANDDDTVWKDDKILMNINTFFAK